MKVFIRNTVFFIGWMLSPLTFWNDALVNIPLSYLCANLFVNFLPRNFTYTVIIFYWLSNFLGLFLMYLSGRHMIKEGKDIIRELVSLFVTIFFYTAILAVFGYAGILRPFLSTQVVKLPV